MSWGFTPLLPSSATLLSAPLNPSGDLSVTEVGVDSFAATANVIVKGSLSATETGTDVFVASGDVIVKATLSVTETVPDSFTASGILVNATTGILSATETLSDTFSATADVIVKGSLTSSETVQDSFTSSGDVLIKGYLSSSDAADSAFISGDVLIQGSLITAETGSDVFAANADAVIQGTFDASEAGLDSFSATTKVIISGGFTASEITIPERFRPANKNLLQNSTNFGAALGVIGSGGSLPTGWVFTNTSFLERSVVGIGTNPDGSPYVDVRVRSLSQSAGIIYFYLQFAPSNAIAVSFGESYTGSYIVDLIAGSVGGFVTNSPGISVAESSANLNDLTRPIVKINTFGQRQVFTKTIQNKSTVVAKLCLEFDVAANSSVDITLRISQPQLEIGSEFTSYSEIAPNIPYGYVLVQGDLSVSDDPDTIDVTAKVIVAGTLSSSENSDVLTSSGSVVVTGSLTSTEQNDVFFATGSQAVTGSLSATEQADSLSFVGKVLVDGALSSNEGVDLFTSVGDVLIKASFTASEQGVDTFSGIAKVVVSGTLSSSEQNDTISASGKVIISGTFVLTENGIDTFSARQLTVTTGVLSATEFADLVNISGDVIVSGVFYTNEVPDTFTANADVLIYGTVQLTEENDKLPGYATDGYVFDGYSERSITGNVIVQGNISLDEEGQDLFVASNLVTKNFIISLKRITYQSANEELILPANSKVIRLA